jgi:hypothetical protein
MGIYQQLTRLASYHGEDLIGLFRRDSANKMQYGGSRRAATAAFDHSCRSGPTHRVSAVSLRVWHLPWGSSLGYP